MTLEIIVDNLRDGYHQLVEGTFQTAAQVQDKRRTHSDKQKRVNLQNSRFYTADGQGYFPVGDDVEWAITLGEHNLVLRHLGDTVTSSYGQLVGTRNFLPGNDEAQVAKSAEGTLVVRMSGLRLSGSDQGSHEWRCLAIRTEDGFVNTEVGYKAPNKDENQVIAWFGYTSKNLAMLRTSPRKIQETRIYVLNPAYVREKVAQNPPYNSVWRASGLNSFSNNSSFFASVHKVYYPEALYGVCHRVAEGDAPKSPVAPTNA